MAGTGGSGGLRLLSSGGFGCVGRCGRLCVTNDCADGGGCGGIDIMRWRLLLRWFWARGFGSGGLGTSVVRMIFRARAVDPPQLAVPIVALSEQIVPFVQQARRDDEGENDENTEENEVKVLCASAAEGAILILVVVVVVAGGERGQRV